MHTTAIRRISLSLGLALLAGCSDDDSTGASESATRGSTASDDPVTASGTMSTGDTVEPVPTSTVPTSSDTTSTSTASSETSALPTTTEAVVGCDDGAQNGEETDVDCGGPCPACAPGQACGEHEDCATQWCVEGVCGEPECQVDDDCAAPGPCQAAWCDPVSRTCEGQPADDGTPCDDDGMLCTAPGECSAGACQAGEGLPALSLAAIPPGAGFVIDGLEAGHKFGHNFAGLGDINGDGREDLIAIGAHYYMHETGSYNPYFVIFGKDDDAPVDLADIEAGIGGFMIFPEPGDTTGQMARVGDVDGDGIDDLVVAWSSRDLEGVNAAAGRVYVVFGKQDTEDVWLEDVFAGVGGFAIVGEAQSGHLGLQIGDAGDVDGDGLADVIMSQPLQPGPSIGRAWVVFGGPAQPPRKTSQIGSGGFMISSPFPNGNFGSGEVHTIGDLDGDGHDDVIIGSSGIDIPEEGSGQAHVVFGKATSATVKLEDVQAGVGGFSIGGVGKWGDLGAEVEGLGDVNGDGFPDLAVAAPHSFEAVGPGRIYIVHGQPDSPGVDVGELEQGIGGSVIYAESDDDYIAQHMAVIGDQNGDGRADILARKYALLVEPDRAYVLFTPAETTPTTVGTLVEGGGGFVIDAVPETHLFAMGAADVNGDGFGDLLLSAYGVDENGEDSGRVYVLFGPTCAP